MASQKVATELRMTRTFINYKLFLMKRLLTLSLLAASLASANAAENARWLRDAAISPDGSKIAFTYKGNIFTVPSSGGNAVQITSNNAYDCKPV